ncbi:hypothetical protein HK100_002364 [Physocladia obscura]|uniref:Heterokaryon incompatibility domain-containing protein n=1 Tax=Physocladia obscura TaxID=109957 RepID=A0AAD5T8A4_9FUNG|nr:hypothetical protein HK100_002364 [Physocladia obscura]
MQKGKVITSAEIDPGTVLDTDSPYPAKNHSLYNGSSKNDASTIVRSWSATQQQETPKLSSSHNIQFLSDNFGDFIKVQQKTNSDGNNTNEIRVTIVNTCNCTMCQNNFQDLANKSILKAESKETFAKALEEMKLKLKKVEIDGIAKDTDLYSDKVKASQIYPNVKNTSFYESSFDVLKNVERGRRHIETWPSRLYEVKRNKTVGGKEGRKFICISYTWPDISQVHNGWYIQDLTDDHKWEVKSISREGLALILSAIDRIPRIDDILGGEKDEKPERWIWSDSLCVDQSDPFDLQSETARSGHYYATSELCLVALWNRIDPNALKSQVTNFLKWCTRAWTAQEALLPTKLYLLALTLKEGSLMPEAFNIDEDEIEVFTDWLGGSKEVSESLRKTRKLRQTFRYGIGLSDALSITLNRESTVATDKIYAAATMSRIVGRIGNRGEGVVDALDWVYRQLLPVDRIKLALVSCRPNSNLEGGSWLPSSAHIFDGYSLETEKDTVSAIVSKYLRGQHCEVFTTTCCDIVVMPDRKWSKGISNFDHYELPKDYAQSTVIADKPDSFYWAQAYINPGFAANEPVKIMASNGIFQGRYRFIAVGKLMKPTDLTEKMKEEEMKKLRSDDDVGKARVEKKHAALLGNKHTLDNDFKLKITDHVTKECQIGLLLAYVGSKGSEFWSKVGLTIVPSKDLADCGPHHEVIKLG